MRRLLICSSGALLESVRSLKASFDSLGYKRRQIRWNC